MGGARNLKLGALEDKDQGTREGAIILCVGQMLIIIFSCCVQQKDVTESRCKGGQSPLKLKHLELNLDCIANAVAVPSLFLPFLNR